MALAYTLMLKQSRSHKQRRSRFPLFSPECTCNFLGTERSQCMEREDCVCQRTTGQCQCLPNVIGLTCDHCAPNHWNLASRNGCEPCGCDPNNSVTSSCNEVGTTPTRPEALQRSTSHDGMPRGSFHTGKKQIQTGVSYLFFCSPSCSSAGSVSVETASEGPPARTVRRTTGGTPRHSAEVRNMKT